MAAEGWKFTVVVPSWTTHRIADESVVLYRVESRVQAPGTEQRKTRSVLRRFSDFRRLHASLKARMPAQMKGKDAPSKRTLYRINSNVEQIEKRRRDLELWLWALLSDPHISCSKELAQFLELGAAAGQFGSSGPLTRSVAGAGSAPSDASHSSAPGSSAGDRDDIDEATEQMSTTGSDMTTSNVDGHIPEASPLGATAKAASGQMSDLGRTTRLGLMIERRPTVRKILTELSDRIERAQADLEDAVQTAENERHAREVMAERLVELEARMSSGAGSSKATAVPHPGEESTIEELKEELLLERRGAALLEEELDATRRALAAAQANATDEEGRRKGEGGAVDAGDERGSIAESSEAAAATLRAAEAMKVEAEAVRAEVVEREAAMKSDMKVLAKEVKKLRRENATAEERAAAAETRAEDAIRKAAAAEEADVVSAEACSSIVALLDSLRGRMALCDIERMRDDGGDEEVESDDLVATSNNRIAALLAEAQLLKSVPQGQSQPPCLTALQHSVADVLTDVGLLRQQLNNSPHIGAIGSGMGRSRRSTSESLPNGKSNPTFEE